MYARSVEDSADSAMSMAAQLKALTQGKLKELLPQTPEGSRRHFTLEVFIDELLKAAVCCLSQHWAAP